MQIKGEPDDICDEHNLHRFPTLRPPSVVNEGPDGKEPSRIRCRARDSKNWSMRCMVKRAIAPAASEHGGAGSDIAVHRAAPRPTLEYLKIPTSFFISRVSTFPFLRRFRNDRAEVSPRAMARCLPAARTTLAVRRGTARSHVRRWPTSQLTDVVSSALDGPALDRITLPSEPPAVQAPQRSHARADDRGDRR